MQKEPNRNKNIFVLFPLFGLTIFILLYVVAALLYPGGSQADKFAVGFSWRHNYWCNLLNEKAINGSHNTARPSAMLGMCVLCVTLAMFWYQFARLVNFKRSTRKIVQVSGIVSGCTAIFLFTRYHDIVINASGILALFALTATFSGLYRMRWQKLFWLGIVNLFLIGLNNFIYYTDGFLMYLPVVQKITFLSFLTWICLIDLDLYKLSTQKQVID